MMKQRANRKVRLCRLHGAENIRGMEEIAESRAACREQANLTSGAADPTCADKESHCVRSRRKRGFTLMEMMVSMALVLLVTAAVVASVQVSYRTIRRDHVEQCAIREAENLALCFESKDFVSGVNLLYGAENADVGERVVSIRFSRDGTALPRGTGSYAWSLTATMDGEGTSLSVRAAYPDGEEIYSTTVIRQKQ